MYVAIAEPEYERDVQDNTATIVIVTVVVCFVFFTGVITIVCIIRYYIIRY